MAILNMPTLPQGGIDTNPREWQEYLNKVDEQIRYSLANIDTENYTVAHKAQITTFQKAAEGLSGVVAELGYYASIKALDELVDTVDGKTGIYYQDDEPAEKEIGDFWYETDQTPPKVKRWTGILWADITDGVLGKALAAAADAKAVADGKIVSLSQGTMPDPALYSEGDLWFDTSNANKPYRHNGTTFVAIQSPVLDNVYIDSNGHLNIKSTDGIFRITITSTALAFYQYDAWIAELSNNRLFIYKAEIADKLTLGTAARGYNDFISNINGMTIDYREA